MDVNKVGNKKKLNRIIRKINGEEMVKEKKRKNLVLERLLFYELINLYDLIKEIVILIILIFILS